MQTQQKPTALLTHGDFTGLAGNYAKYRPAYAQSVLDCVLALVKKPVSEISFADVGAGTGIWTRMVAQRGCERIMAVEPNADMREEGESGNNGIAIEWLAGSGEATGLQDSSFDLVSMASSFHWVDFEAGTREFHRILRPGGRFVALWNPRLIEANPLLVDIENKLYEMAPHIHRVSSGRSLFTSHLTERLWESPFFTDVVYLEGLHTAALTPAEYIGAWKSVNDIQVQAGPEVFSEFIHYLEGRLADVAVIEATYQTRAWSAMKQG